MLAITLLLLTLSERVQAAMTPTPDVAAVRKLGPQAIPALIEMYKKSAPDQRAEIARTFYELGWKSDAAKKALMKDINTEHPALRLQVQWALGRVSPDKDVVDTLARIMQTDANPLFRDKAACALAYDQIHLTEREKFRLYQQVVAALRDPKLQVRQIAAQVLQIHLGQSKGFDPQGPLAQREKAVRAWEAWLQEYESNL